MSIRNIKITVGGTPVGQAQTWSYPESDGKIYLIPTYKMTVEGKTDAGAAQSRSYEVFRFGVMRKSKTGQANVVGLADAQTHTIKAWLPDYSVHSASSVEQGAWQVYKSFLIHDGPDQPDRELYASIGCVEVCYGPGGFDKFNDFIIELSGSKKTTRGEQLKEIGASGKLVITYLKSSRPTLQEK